MTRSVAVYSPASRVLWLGCAGYLLIAIFSDSAAARDYDGMVTVGRNETFVLNPDETIRGDLVVVGGDVTVRGKVEGDVILADGRLVVGKECSVDGRVLMLKAAQEVSRERGSKPQPITASAADLVELMQTKIEKGLRQVEAKGVLSSARVATGDILRFAEAVVIPRGERRDGDVVSFGGDVVAEGDVNGDVAAFGGKVTIDGEVSGDVASYGGGVELKDGAHVKGNVASFGARVTRARGARVDGAVNDVTNPTFPSIAPSILYSKTAAVHNTEALRLMSWLWGVLAAIVIVVLVVLIAPNATRTIAGRTHENPGRAVAHGLLAVLLFVPVCVLLCITCVGVLLIPVLVIALLLALVMGTVAVSSIMGRRLSDTFRWRVRSLMGTAMVGMLALQVLDLLTLVPVVGVAAGLLGIVVALFGLGGAIMTGFGTDRECGFVTRRFTRRHTGAGGYVPSSVPGHGGDQDDWSGDDSVA